MLNSVAKTTASCQLLSMLFLKRLLRHGLLNNKLKKLAAAASATKTWSEDELVANGEAIYNANCSGCHQKDGSGIPGVFPAMTGSILPMAQLLTT